MVKVAQTSRTMTMVAVHAQATLSRSRIVFAPAFGTG
jgi:hypothetical protein